MDDGFDDWECEVINLLLKKESKRLKNYNAKKGKKCQIQTIVLHAGWNFASTLVQTTSRAFSIWALETTCPNNCSRALMTILLKKVKLSKNHKQKIREKKVVKPGWAWFKTV